MVVFENAPILEVAIGVSREKFMALRAAGEPIPDPRPVRALIDTGTQNTLADYSIFRELGLAPTESTELLYTPGRGHPLDVRTCQVAVYIGASWSIGELTVFAVSLQEFGLEAIIGRDILRYATFTYRRETFSLSF